MRATLPVLVCVAAVHACSGGDDGAKNGSSTGGEAGVDDGGGGESTASGGAAAGGRTSAAGGATSSSGGTPLDAGTDAPDPPPADAGADGPPSEGGGVALPDYRSGARLRARVYETVDGERMWHGWYDPELEMQCSFRLAEDGETRCLPLEFASTYTDAECKNPVYIAADGCSLPTHVLTESSTPCGGNPLFSVGAKATPLGLYARNGSTCADVGAPDVGRTYYSLTAVLATAAVAGKALQDPRGKDSVLSYLATDDGALQPVSAYDPARATACRSSAPPFDERCAPSDVAYVSSSTQFWQDEGCTTTRLAARFGCLAAPPVAVSMLLPTSDQCGHVTMTTSFSEISAESFDPSFVSNQGSCTANTIASGPHLFGVGAPIPPEAVPRLPTVDSGTGRIKLRYFAAGSGEKILVRALYDSERGEECTPTTTADGLRCVPSASIVSSFSDDQCTKAVAFTALPSGACPAPIPPAFVRSGGWSTSCYDELTETHYHSVGAKLVDPSLYQGVTTCEAAGGISGVDAYETTEIPIATFATLRDVTE